MQCIQFTAQASLLLQLRPRQLDDTEQQSRNLEWQQRQRWAQCVLEAAQR